MNQYLVINDILNDVYNQGIVFDKFKFQIASIDSSECAEDLFETT